MSAKPGHIRDAVISGALILSLAVIAPVQCNPIKRALYLRDGYILMRNNPGSIYLASSSDSGFVISPEQTLHWFNPWLGSEDPPDGATFPYRLTPIRNAWMLDLAQYNGDPFTYTFLINPKNRYAEAQIREIVRLASQEPRNVEAITKLAAKHYIFLGWTIQNEEDARILCDALKANWNLDRSKPIAAGSTMLYPIDMAAAKKASEDPAETARIESLSASIPIFMENVDPSQGHPADSMHVLYLDGHAENIPFGSRFPATQVFLDAIRIPEDTAR